MLCTITTVLTVVFSVYVGLDGRIQPCLLHVAFSDRRVLLYVLLVHNHDCQIGDEMHYVFGLSGISNVFVSRSILCLPV